MKKINQNNLKLDKEVISSLSEGELTNVKGGTMVTGQMTEPGVECFVLSMNIACRESIDIKCKESYVVPCVVLSDDRTICEGIKSSQCAETEVCYITDNTQRC